jgi:hypothetical protein
METLPQNSAQTVTEHWPKEPATTLYLGVTDSFGHLPQGNMFAAVQHLDSGSVWRTLRWHQSTKSFLFRNLPSGRFSYHVWASENRSTDGYLELRAESLRHSVVLPPGVSRPRLEIPIQGRLAEMRTLLGKFGSNAVNDNPLRSRLAKNSAGGIFLDIRNDGILVASVTRPFTHLNLKPTHWEFLTSCCQPGQTTDVIAARARFLIVTLAIGRNSAVRQQLAPRATDAQIWGSLLGVLATLDDPDLDEYFEWAAQLYSPEVARFERFARAWADRFNGLNSLRSIARYRVALPDMSSLLLPPPPVLPQPIDDPAVRDIAAPVLADVAHILHSILEYP